MDLQYTITKNNIRSYSGRHAKTEFLLQIFTGDNLIDHFFSCKNNSKSDALKVVDLVRKNSKHKLKILIKKHLP